MENVMQTHMFFKKEIPREEEKKSDGKGEKSKLPEKKRQKKNEKESGDGENQEKLWKEKVMSTLTANGPLTKESMKKFRADNPEELNGIANKVFPEGRKLPEDLKSCPLCHNENFKLARFLKRHMVRLDCHFNAIFNNDNSDCEEKKEVGEEEKREREEKDTEKAKEKADMFYGMSFKRKQGAELTGVVYGTLPSLELSDQDQINVLNPLDTVVPLITSIEKLQKWKIANENLIERWNVDLHFLLKKKSKNTNKI